ncbi:MAG: LD-carboxypeptidase [Prolixibacteraceae bacterium]|nr:LD-carboxypeptidase [Prolixibacteraceae bacterium]
MIQPPFLKKGDKIILVSVAGKVRREPVEKAVQLLEEEDYRVQITPNAFGRFHMFSGMVRERASDMQQALDDPNVKAILFARGGYGSIRTLMLLDWSGFFKHPKWLIGFSDITVFHSFLTCHEVASIHGVMPSFFFDGGVRTESLNMLLNLLRGKSLSYRIPGDRLNRAGIAKGILIGGNLSLLMSLRGTEIDLSYVGRVLFIEDIGEYDYHIDRMMMNLKFGECLSRLAGLIVGYFTDTKSSNTPFGKSAYEIIQDAVSGYDFPVVFGFPCGHELPNFPLVMGSEISIEVTEEGVLINQSF